MTEAATANGAIDDPSIRQRLMEFYTKVQILRINGLRNLTSTLNQSRTWGRSRSGPRTRCSGRRCTRQRWNWRSTSTAPKPC